MPNLSIIPAAAVLDHSLTHSQLRALCAVGIHTNKLGGGVWASVKTLATEAGMGERTFQQACGVLVERGYLVVTPRVGRTNLYEVVLQPPPQPAAPPQELLHPTPAEAVAPKRPKGTTPQPTYEVSEARKEKHLRLKRTVDALLEAYPKRPEPVPYPAALRAVGALLDSGITEAQLLNAVDRYATHCKLNDTKPQYIKSFLRFHGSDETWKTYDVRTLYGRTREEWIRSGQDVAEFDRLTQPREEEAGV